MQWSTSKGHHSSYQRQALTTIYGFLLVTISDLSLWCALHHSTDRPGNLHIWPSDHGWQIDAENLSAILCSLTSSVTLTLTIEVSAPMSDVGHGNQLAYSLKFLTSPNHTILHILRLKISLMTLCFALLTSKRASWLQVANCLVSCTFFLFNLRAGKGRRKNRHRNQSILVPWGRGHPRDHPI